MNLITTLNKAKQTLLDRGFKNVIVRLEAIEHTWVGKHTSNDDDTLSFTIQVDDDAHNFVLVSSVTAADIAECTRIVLAKSKVGIVPEHDSDQYDSRPDTLEHIERVQRYMIQFAQMLGQRSHIHDASKLEDPEKPFFDEYTPKLANVTYGSDDYSLFLTELYPALLHHYENNPHHPQHWESGVDEMSLLDIVEMLCDWKAATERHNDGDITKSINHNEKRFAINPQLIKIFHNTITRFGWEEESKDDLH